MSQITVDLNHPLLSLDSTVQGDETLGQIVANNVLMRSAKGPALKYMSWARTLYDNKPLSLDKTDLEAFQKVIEENEVITNFVKGPVLEILFAARSAPEKIAAPPADEVKALT